MLTLACPFLDLGQPLGVLEVLELNLIKQQTLKPLEDSGLQHKDQQPTFETFGFGAQPEQQKDQQPTFGTFERGQAKRGQARVSTRWNVWRYEFRLNKFHTLFYSSPFIILQKRKIEKKVGFS